MPWRTAVRRIRGILGRSAHRRAKGLLRVLMLGFCEAPKGNHEEKELEFVQRKHGRMRRNRKWEVEGLERTRRVCGDHLR